LALRENGSVESDEDVFDGLACCEFEDLGLGRVVVEHPVEVEVLFVSVGVPFNLVG